MKIRKQCIECKSTDVRWDAWAEWNEDKQKMELAEFYDECWCNNCEGETVIEEVIIKT